MGYFKKGLEALVSEEGQERDLFLSFLTFGYNSTLHVGTGYSPFFSLHGSEAVLLVQRYLDDS